MATLIDIYNPFKKYMGDGTIVFGTDTLKIALVTSAYTPNAEHGQWADVSANEVATGSGYTTGGATLGTVTYTRSGGTTTLDAADPSWTTLTKTFRYAVIYANVTRNGVTNPLIACILLDDTPADVVVTATTWAIAWAATGILTHS